MTKKEIAALLGINIYRLNKCFVKAESLCESLKNKKSHYNKKMSVDYTWDEFVIASQFLKDEDSPFTPAMKVFMKENWIERDVPYKMNEMNAPYSEKAAKFIKKYLAHKDPDACVTCVYIAPRANNNRLEKGNPYCTFYNCFLNKYNGKRDYYKDCCMTYMRSKRSPYIYTRYGPVTIENLGKFNNTVAGIPQSEFKSKRAKNEPITIIRDMFANN